MDFQNNKKELIDNLDTSVYELSALMRAVTISPFVTTCTLGPIKEYSKEVSSSGHQVTVTPEKIALKRDKTPNKSESSSTRNENVSPNKSMQCTDFNLIKGTVLRKNLEKESLKAHRQEIENFKNALLKENEKRKNILQKHQEENNKWITRKISEETQIFKQVENSIKTVANEGEIQRQQLQHKIKKIIIDAIFNYQKIFIERHHTIHNILITSGVSNKEEYSKEIKDTLSIFESLLQNIKQGRIDISGIKVAYQLCQSMKDLQNRIQQDVTQQIELSEAQQAHDQIDNKAAENPVSSLTVATQQQLQSGQVQEMQLQIQQQEQTNLAAPKQTTNNIIGTTQTNNSNVPTSLCVNPDQLAFYNEIMNFYMKKIESVKQLQMDDNMKKYRFACQKAINTPVNTISAVSPQHLQDKFQRLLDFISGKPVKTGDVAVSCMDHPLGKDFALMLLAKKIVSQGDSMVSSNAPAAFAIASVAVALWQAVPDFGKLFLAYTYKECPYVVPHIIQPKEGQSAEDYCKALGYRFIDGVLEKQDMYLKRLSGIARLYGAIMITAAKHKMGPHPFGIENGWKLLCNLMNLDPVPDISATIMYEVLQNIGFELTTTYGKQFTKLLKVMQIQYFPKLSKIDKGGPKARLEVFLAKILNEGRIERPLGLLPDNFW